METRMETFVLGGGWTVDRIDAERAGLDALRLVRKGREVWELEIPPKMPTTDMLAMAQVLTALWESAFRKGAEACRELLQQVAARVTGHDVLDEY